MLKFLRWLENSFVVLGLYLLVYLLLDWVF
jgi:hypothetical protein